MLVKLAKLNAMGATLANHVKREMMTVITAICL